MTIGTAFIECERVVKLYRVGGTDVTALGGLDLRVDAGEMVGIVGPSGCGKSTLLNIIGALQSPTSGRVTVGGSDLSTLSRSQLDRFRKLEVGFVWQETGRNLIPYLDAIGNVMVPMRLAGVKQARSRAYALLDLVGLADRAEHFATQLSGGQQQRVAIAVALANEPGLLLADEPTGELDGETAEEVYQVLRDVSERLGVTVVMVSHDPNMASVTDRIVELRDGQSATERWGAETDHGGKHVLLVDTVGRVRMPDEFRAQLGTDPRVVADMSDGRITLKPIGAPDPDEDPDQLFRPESEDD